MTVSRNVVYRTTGSSIIVGGAGSVVTGNLAMVTSTVQPNRPSDNHAVDFPASYDIDRGNTVRDNAAAGTNRISYRYGGERCHDDEQPKLNEEVWTPMAVFVAMMYRAASYYTAYCTVKVVSERYRVSWVPG